MFQKLNVILSKPTSFPQIPAPTKDCRSMTFPPDRRNGQHLMRPEQDCKCLVYYGDQSRSMIDVLGLGQDPFWDDRVKGFYEWYSKSASKTGQDAWKWEVYQMLLRGTSQSQPIHLIARILRRRQFHGETLVNSMRIRATSIQVSQQIQSVQFQRMTTCAKRTSSSICKGSSRFLITDGRHSKDPRLCCAYCDMNKHPRFTCKHAYKHRKETEKHRCTLCTAFHAPFCFPKAHINSGSGKPNLLSNRIQACKPRIQGA